MSNFSFETITAAQALGVTAGDSLTVSSGPAYAATVLYGAAGDITLILGAQTVDFGGGLAALSQAGGVTFTDGTVLYVGDAGANTKDFGLNSATSGAVFGGDGDDTVTVGHGHFLVQLNAGNDSVSTSGFGDDTIYGGQGNDTIALGAQFGSQGHGFAQGNRGNDIIFGSEAPNTILGGQGDDTVSGVGGAADFINGNLGNDLLSGQGQLFGEDGNDTITTRSEGPSTVSGGNGDDLMISGGNGGVGAASLLFGDDGDDFISIQSPAHDEAHGGSGNDTLLALSGGRDSIEGGAGNDSLSDRDHLGDHGDTTLNGGDGADTIEGAGGNDLVFGGAGGDYFYMDRGDSNLQAGQIERIMDWSAEDHIVPFDVGVPPRNYFEAAEPDYATALSLAQNSTGNEVIAVQVGGDVIVFATPPSAANGAVPDAVMLVGRSLTDIDASNFTLPPT